MCEMLELWTPPPNRPAYVFVDDDGKVEFGPNLTDLDVYCDYCNRVVVLRPVPVVDGYALCHVCWSKKLMSLILSDDTGFVFDIPSEILELWLEQVKASE